ncbi:hypothetical protein [Aureibaculum conchae]|uniref:hypothetical protein n=1 Tax=Aureibaculum sp. 2308TA14-22 TaxID=3108392 RepID=UPI00339710DD
MKSAKIFCSIFIFIVGSNTILLAQNNLEEKNYYKWFDKSIGQENTALFNGELYTKSYRTQDKNHNFLLTNDFVTGTVEFDNQKYYDILLKYDIFNDELVAKLKSSFNSNSNIQLNKAFVEGFTIHNKKFKFINSVTEAVILKGFYEVAYSSSMLSLYTKHHKLKANYIIDDLIYSKFSKRDKNILLYKNSFYEIKNKKELRKIFPNLNREINTIYKNNKRLKKIDNNAFIKTVIQKIEQHL